MPHRLMKMPLDSSHIEVPWNVAVALGSGLASIAVAAWQFVGSKLAQLPTPDKVSGWQERDIYLCALIIACGTIAWMGRWIAVKFMQRDKESLDVVRQNTESNWAVAEALKAFTNQMNGIITPAVTMAMQETFKPDLPRPLGSTRKCPPETGT